MIRSNGPVRNVALTAEIQVNSKRFILSDQRVQVNTTLRNMDKLYIYIHIYLFMNGKEGLITDFVERKGIGGRCRELKPDRLLEQHE